MRETTFNKTLRGYALVKTLGITVLVILTLVSIAGAAPFAYIANYGSSTVSVIDTATNKVTATVSVGISPYGGIAVNPTGTKVYVANSYDISVIDTATNKVTATKHVLGSGSGYLSGVAVNPAGTKVYVAAMRKGYFVDGLVYVIDAATNKVTATIKVGVNPMGVAVNQEGSMVYVTNSQTDTFSIIDTATNEVANTINIDNGFGGYYYNLSPYGVAFTPNGQHVYMADSGSNTVFDFYTSSYIIVGKRPSGVASTPDGKKVFVTNTDDNTVSVIDTTTNKVTATVNVGINPYGVAVTPDGKKVFVTNANSKNVTIIDTATNKVTATVNLGSDPISFGQFIGPASPVADFVASPTTGRAPFKVAFTEKNTGLLTSRAWLFGDGATSTARNPTHVYSKPGTYNVLLKVTNGAGSNSKIKFSYITVQQARS